MPSLPLGSLDAEERAFLYAESISVDYLPEKEDKEEEASAEKNKQSQISSIDAEDGKDLRNLDRQKVPVSDEAPTRVVAKCVICRFVCLFTETALNCTLLNVCSGARMFALTFTPLKAVVHLFNR